MLIADIAQRAKVSPATVSRVINQPHLVAPDRLARVQAVMTAVNYVPTPLHRRRGPKSRHAPPDRTLHARGSFLRLILSLDATGRSEIGT